LGYNQENPLIMQIKVKIKGMLTLIQEKIDDKQLLDR
jgi:hypothetical protein